MITVVSAGANAVLLTGDISISGDATAVGGTDWGTATGIAFPDNDFVVDTVSGDFADFATVGDIGTINDFTFLPTFTTVDPLWTIGDLSFVLETIVVETQVSILNVSYMVLTGTGIFSATGYEDTFGTFVLTANSAGTSFNFSSSAAAVPEPSTLLLLSAGLLLLGFVRRQRT
jgi:hypothetical protein